MSFWPFPKTILDELRVGLDHGVGLEVGAGTGRLRSRLAGLGIELMALDRTGPVDLRADARALPLRADVAGLVVLANLLRHLTPADRSRVLSECARVGAPGSRLLLLEDDPRPRDPAERNYRRALELLARRDRTRGAAMDLGPVLAEAAPGFDIVADQCLENEETVEDPGAPLRWLHAVGQATDPELRELDDAVERQGMSYGRFRACVLRRRDPGRPS